MLDAIAARRDADARCHPAPHTAAIREQRDPSRPREQLAAAVSKHRDTATAVHQPDHDPSASQPLRHVAVIDNEKLERPAAPRPQHAKPAQLEPAHDPARCADDDHDADAHPHGDARGPLRARGEEHERVVIPRLDAGWQVAPTVKDAFAPGRRTRRRGRTVSQEVAARGPLRATILGRPRRSSAKPARCASTAIGRLPALAMRIVARPVPASITRDGDAVSATGERVLLVPAAAGTSTEHARTMPAMRIIGR